ncbi:MAG: hypothetical protein ACYDFT_08255, partial [Thermoplasmata archaeon]
RLDPLESKWGFVRPGAGGGRVRITPQGRLALALFGRPEGAPVAPPRSRGRPADGAKLTDLTD